MAITKKPPQQTPAQRAEQDRAAEEFIRGGAPVAAEKARPTSAPAREKRSRAGRPSTGPKEPKLVQFPLGMLDELTVLAGAKVPGKPINHVIVEAVQAQIEKWKRGE